MGDTADAREAATAPPARALLLSMGAEHLLIPLDRVREVVARPFVSSLPTGPPSLIGLFSLRGEIVPLFDPAGLLGFGEWSAPAYAVVVDVGGHPGGLATAASPEVVALGERIAESDGAHSTGTYALDPYGPALMIDVDALLAVGAGSPRA